MGLLSAVTSRVQTTVKQVERTTQQTVPSQLPSQPRPAVDSFTPSVASTRGAVTLSLGNNPVASLAVRADGAKLRVLDTAIDHNQSKGTGVSQLVFGRQVGVHGKLSDGAATMGAVSVEAAGRETVVGLVPAAPQVLVMPVYSGADRDGEKL